MICDLRSTTAVQSIVSRGSAYTRHRCWKASARSSIIRLFYTVAHCSRSLAPDAEQCGYNERRETGANDDAAG